MAAPLVQIQPSSASPAEPARKPSWLKVKAPGGPNYVALKHMMRDLKLHTVCEEAHCPNIGECWEHKAATFMILGDVCTRNCAYCAVAHGTPAPLDAGEPQRLDRKSTRLNSSHLVISYAVFCLKKKKKKTTHDFLRHVFTKLSLAAQIHD